MAPDLPCGRGELVPLVLQKACTRWRSLSAVLV
jgi:hypothetical protein